MQNNKITHNDIKLSNIIYDKKTNQVYLIDYGISYQHISNFPFLKTTP